MQLCSTLSLTAWRTLQVFGSPSNVLAGSTSLMDPAYYTQVNRLNRMMPVGRRDIHNGSQKLA